MVVDNGTEAEAAAPAGGHVQDVDPGVALGHWPAPGLQGLRTLQRHTDYRSRDNLIWKNKIKTYYFGKIPRQQEKIGTYKIRT